MLTNSDSENGNHMGEVDVKGQRQHGYVASAMVVMETVSGE